MEYFPAVIERCTPAATAAFILTDNILLTAHPFIVGEKKLNNLKYFLEVHGDKKIIMDSGVYSLLKKDGYFTEDVLIAYTHKYLELIEHLKFTHPYVEVDSQYIEEKIGTYKKLREIYPNPDQVIFTWHSCEIQEDLIELAKTYKRIAFSPKDIKVHLKALGKTKKYKTAVRGLANVIRPYVQKKHVHILGSVLPELADLPDNWTCDSASYGSTLFWDFIFRGNQWRIDVRGKKRKDWIVPRAVKNKVDPLIPKMQEIYKNHPEYGKRVKSDRIDHLLMLAYSLCSWLFWWKEMSRS